MLHKDFDLIETKAEGDSGTFTALCAVFGNVDAHGDRILPGAFTKSLERWRAGGDPVPVILSHRAEDPMAHIGVADPEQITQTERGLMVKGQLDVTDNDVARQVHRLLKRRSLKAFSFGYLVPKGGERRKDGVNEISELELVEVGPTLKGANPEAQLQEVKSALEAEAPLEAPLFPDWEMSDAQSGSLKAVWTTAYINSLPDSCFLYIAPGGEKDGEGKTTPRSLRYFPYKDASGAVDLPHLRNALARIPQSNLPADVKARLTAKAQRLLSNQKSEPVEDAASEEPLRAKHAAQDPLRRRSELAVLEIAGHRAKNEKRI